MKIYVKQIDEGSLTAFVTGAAGQSLSGQLNSYLQNGGYLGVNVVYASGGTQVISGSKIFVVSPTVPYSGLTGTAPSRLYVDNQITAASALYISDLSGISGSIFNTGKNLSFVQVTGSSGLQIANFTGLGSVNVSLLSGNLIGVSGNSNDTINLSGRLFTTGANLSALSVTGSFMQTPNFTGMGGTLVIRSGNFVLISGTATAGNSNVSITGSTVMSSPNFTGMGGTLVIQSGNFVLISGAGAGAATNNGDGINLSGNLNASGRRAWDDATNLSGRLFTTGANLSAVSITGSAIMQVPNFTGMGGTLIIQSGNFVLISGGGGGASSVSITGSSTIATPNFTGMAGTLVIQSGNFVLVSGATATTTLQINNFNITGTGTTYITNTASGNQTNTVNNYSGTVNTNPIILNGITGNFVNMSFYFDESNLITGLSLVETFIARDFTFTGYGLGLIVSGRDGFLSGSLYQRNSTNTKTKFIDFSLNSGIVWYASGGFQQTISGMNRVGVDLVRLSSGCTGFALGAFGVGY